eukprot:3932043-Rhodomonas_salina.3
MSLWIDCPMSKTSDPSTCLNAFIASSSETPRSRISSRVSPVISVRGEYILSTFTMRSTRTFPSTSTAAIQHGVLSMCPRPVATHSTSTETSRTPGGVCRCRRDIGYFGFSVGTGLKVALIDGFRHARREALHIKRNIWQLRTGHRRTAHSSGILRTKALLAAGRGVSRGGGNCEPKPAMLEFPGRGGCGTSFLCCACQREAAMPAPQ